MKDLKSKTFAILIPSYKRKEDLMHTISNTPLCGLATFLVVANYEQEEYNELENSFSDKAIFINERNYGKLGASGAFNLGYLKSIELGFTYSILYADDVIPFDANWLHELKSIIDFNNIEFGIFSSDECHHGYFGWNIIKDAPIAHFFVVRNALVDYLFEKSFKQYVIDFEISVRLIKAGVDIYLLPIKVNHLRSHLHREAMIDNYLHDSEVFYKLYPEYVLYMDKIPGKKYLPHANFPIQMKEVKKNNLKYYPGIDVSSKKIFLQYIKGFLKYLLIKLSNIFK